MVPLYARCLRAKEYGVLSLLNIALSLLVIMLRMGLSQAFFRYYYETADEGRRRRMAGSTLIFLLIVASLAVGAGCQMARQISALLFAGDRNYVGVVRLVLLTSLLEVIMLVPESILRAKFKSMLYSGLSLAALIFQVALISYMVIFVEASVKSVVIGRFIGAAFEAALFLLFVRGDLKVSFSWSEIKQMLAFGAPLVAGQLSFTLFVMVDRFFLDSYAGRAAVGIYSMANQIASIISVLVVAPFGQVWSVMRFAVMMDESAEEYYSRMLTYISFAGVFSALCVGAIAGDCLRLFAQAGYWPAAELIPLLGLGAALDGAAQVLNVGITLKKRTIFSPLIMGAALGFNVAVNYLLIPRYGVMGATASTLVSYLFLCALRFAASNLFFKVRYEWGRIFGMWALGAATVAAFYAIDLARGFISVGVPASMLAKLALALCFPLWLFVIGFYDERERRRMAEIWHRLSHVAK
jgi:O-antigen/teichoic acid export membrane protein